MALRLDGRRQSTKFVGHLALENAWTMAQTANLEPLAGLRNLTSSIANSLLKTGEFKASATP